MPDIIYPAFNTVESTYQNINPFHNLLYLTRIHHMAIIFQMTWANHNFYAVFLRTISKRTPIRPIPIIFDFICGIRNNGKCYFNALFVQLTKLRLLYYQVKSATSQLPLNVCANLFPEMFFLLHLP